MLGTVTGEAVLRITPPYGGAIVLLLGGLFYYWLIPKIASRLSNSPLHVRLRDAVTPRQHALFLSGLVLLALMESWPSLELARYVSSLAYLTHNMLIELVAVPLLLLGIPHWLFHRLTETPFVDALLEFLTSPILTTVLYAALFVLSMLAAIVEAQATSLVVYVYLQVAFVVIGALMWIPALRLNPGTRKLSTGGRVIYLFAQSLLPTFPAFVLIFSHHSFYPIFATNLHLIFGASEVGDQQLAGAIPKLIDFGILWTVAVAIMVRAQKQEDLGADPEPITWLDVEREFKRTQKNTGA
ncbi:cytochrome c oxidase assembly protein [Ferrimicrobium sp.]|uniref:cytochrome c oxidase assembly protein n=1 Tax=Ferrimicrobium sp. TaxID=2926050 RepID=UPI002626453E|nr:cytochrome c oxidase assembly protein [Ferrimicrobium sp.]